MKKLLSIVLTIVLLSMLAVPVFAVDISDELSNDIKDMTYMLNDSYNGVETGTTLGWFVPLFNVFTTKDGTINICANCHYHVFGDIRESDSYLVEDKELAIANIKKHMQKIADVLMEKYPDYKFKGWYESDYTNIKNEEVIFRVDYWTNVKGGKVSKDIIWLTEMDSQW